MPPIKNLADHYTRPDWVRRINAMGDSVGGAEKLIPLEADALRAHCAERIAKYKVPRYIWFLDRPLPRTASGKFLKKQLREELDPADAS